ncbi:MAG TPA: hypothetical protein VNL95_01345 [Dehalococcoidia bacterium]|nr:hypothetical protein [Dehalococcoidia bacterium]
MMRRLFPMGLPRWPLGRGRGRRGLLVVAGAPTRQEAERCQETLRRQGIPAQMRRGRSGFEIWVPAETEAEARLLLGLSGRSCIRVARPKASGSRTA